LRVLDEALRVPGARFGGGLLVLPAARDEAEDAIDEAQGIALWASESDAEWVRALGGLAEAFAQDPIGVELQRRFEEGLGRIARADGSRDRFDVVLRQLQERALHRAAFAAARIASAAHPDDTLIQSVCANEARALGDSQAACEHYETAARLLEAGGSPSAMDAWNDAGNAAVRLGDRARAEAAFARARNLASAKL
jgi:hypothetical protein